MPATKRKPLPPAPRLVLPKTCKPTHGEIAVFSRLVRVMRQKDNRGSYWLGPFIEWLLYADAVSPDLNYIFPRIAIAALKTIDPGDPIFNGSAFLKSMAKECSGATFVSATSAFVASASNPKETWDSQILPVNEEDQFYQILRLWRIEHPEPEKPRKFPKGRTQHESDPDSD